MATKVRDYNAVAGNSRVCMIIGMAVKGTDGEMYVLESDPLNPGLPVTGTFTASSAQTVEDVNLAQSLDSSFNSATVATDTLSKFAFHVIRTSSGSASGTFVVQLCSTDSATATDWVDFSPSLSYVNADGSVALQVNEVAFPFARLKWTASSGSGTVVDIKVIKKTGA